LAKQRTTLFVESRKERKVGHKKKRKGRRDRGRIKDFIFVIIRKECDY
jgi:hypothetical protein